MRSPPRLPRRRRKVTAPLFAAGSDPYVTAHGGWFYYCQVDYHNAAVYVRRARDLLDLARAEAVQVWRPEPGREYSHELWAPELHRLDGAWYVYVTASDAHVSGGAGSEHRMFVLRASTDDPQSPFTLLGKITDPTDLWAIDGTVLALHGRWYFLWSGRETAGDLEQALYIAPMSDPWTISGPRTCISRPRHAWERAERHGVNEGPQVLHLQGRVHVVYSANGAWTDDYCLGQLTLTGPDPLEPSSWTKQARPVFAADDAVFGPGHASFLLDDRGRHGWMVAHAAQFRGAGWERHIIARSFTWEADGRLDFRPTRRPRRAALAASPGRLPGRARGSRGDAR